MLLRVVVLLFTNANHAELDFQSTSPEKWGDRYQELIALYNKLLLRQ